MSRRVGGTAGLGRSKSSTWSQGKPRRRLEESGRPRSAGRQTRTSASSARTTGGSAEGSAPLLNPAMFASATMQSILGTQAASEVSPASSLLFPGRALSPELARGSRTGASSGVESLKPEAAYGRQLPLSRSRGALIYNSHFSGLQSIGQSGMTILEELIDAAMAACERGHEAGLKDPSRGAALLTSEGLVFTGCDVSSREGDAQGASAERVAALTAVSEGAKRFDCVVVASDSTMSFPVPDGAHTESLPLEP